MLDGRRGWRFEDDPMDPCWCFGEAGAARLVATVRNGEFYVHDDDNERDTPFPVGSTLIVLWLDENEPKHLGPTGLQIDLGAALIPGRTERWLQECLTDDVQPPDPTEGDEDESK